MLRLIGQRLMTTIPSVIGVIIVTIAMRASGKGERANAPAAMSAQVAPAKVLGNVAYSVSRTQLTGDYKDKPVDVVSKETLVLVDNGDGWKIVHVHWSH